MFYFEYSKCLCTAGLIFDDNTKQKIKFLVTKCT